jgi:hypothetical protein
VNAILVVITLVSAAFAAAMGVLAWRMATAERRRSEARVAALAESLESPDSDIDVPLNGLDDSSSDPGAYAASMFGAVSDESRERAMFSGPARDPAEGAPRFAVVGLVLVILVSGLAIAWTTARALAPAASVTTAAPAPLELLSLSSTRKGRELLVAGVVRNPVRGAPVEHLAAVVLFFDERGAFLTSSRAPLDQPTLTPGAESPFQLTLAAPEGTTRYRVSFRRAEGAVVPHVDRRALGEPGATSAATRGREAGL